MSWAKLDDGFAEHPKITGLSPRDFQVVVRALCYAARRRDPHISPGTLPLLSANKSTAKRLENAGLWEANGDGWVIHDWEHYQPRSGAERQKKYRERKRQQGDAA